MRLILATFEGTVPPEVLLATDRGRVPDDFRVEQMLIVMKRSPEREQAMSQLVDALHDPESSTWHQWIGAADFHQRFGAAPADRAQVVAWLQGKGFEVKPGPAAALWIEFAGNAAQINGAFHTELHNLEVQGVRRFANVKDIQIPEALAPLVEGVDALHDLVEHQDGPAFSSGKSVGGVPQHFTVPGDITRIYDVQRVHETDHNVGSGQTIALVEDGDPFHPGDDWLAFRKIFKVSVPSGTPEPTYRHVHPQGLSCAAPHLDSTGKMPAAGEADMDPQYASATAPGANMILATCQSTTTPGWLIASINLINDASTPDIISVSYTGCEGKANAARNALINSTWAQAATEGISVFVATGDQGAAACDFRVKLATHGITLSGAAATAFDTAVGGTDFKDVIDRDESTYWQAKNRADFSSVKSYLPEMPWDSTCAGALLAQFHGKTPNAECNAVTLPQSFFAASGGRSACGKLVNGKCEGREKPSYQRAFFAASGQKDDQVRDIPDVSLFSGGPWQHKLVSCESQKTATGPTTPCTDDPKTWKEGGGTSYATPMMAGIQALINVRAGGRQGIANFQLYKLAARQYGAGSAYKAECKAGQGAGVGSGCIFRDVTDGDITVPCQPGKPDCFVAHKGDKIGVLSESLTTLDAPFAAHDRYDLATGLGSVDAYNLVHAWELPKTPKPVSLQTCEDGCATARDSCKTRPPSDIKLCAHQLEVCERVCKEQSSK